MRIGIDIGGTNIKAGILTQGQLSRFVTLPTGKTKEEFLDRLIEIIRNLSGGHTLGIGIGCPGPANYALGLILKAHNLPVNDFNLKHYLRTFFKTEIIIKNDTVAFTLGEALYGAGENKRLVLGITLGTGVGGGIVLDRKPVLGKGNAGEVCSMVVRDSISDDPKFKYNTFETLCSERGLVKRAIGFNTGSEMFEAASKGNNKIIQVFKEYGRDLGICLGSVITILDPDIVVLGGGLCKSWKFFQESMHKAIKEVTPFEVDVVPPANEYAGVIGAASLID